MSDFTNITLTSSEGTIELDNIEIYEFSEDTLNFLKSASDAVKIFFSTEIDMDNYEDIDEDIMTELTEAITLTGFSDPIRAIALQKHLDIPFSEITEQDEDGTIFEADGAEYLVVLDEEADDLATEYAKNLIDDLGLESFSDYAKEHAYENFVDGEWFKDVQEESAESYAYDIKDDSASDQDLYVSRLHEEMVENGIMDAPEWPEEPDDATDEETEEWENETEEYRIELENEVESKISDFTDDMYKGEDPVEWFRDNFGKELLVDAVKNNNLLDTDALAEWVVQEDGRGVQLASYDHNENEETVSYRDETNVTYYIYRTN